ncbi:MAG: Chloramphenicol acetyltransferase [Candidatus Accumulibacter regalis]|jgi:chloramphenicol O-acetyltransferase type B|uniref:Chloramphenicol acetyltransferase n=1 Tax=Accumulibacter regalis TaxID=522306 RepID=A0A011P1F4_ACCRE|nr:MULTISPECIES: CatB-related O-acetyltransferase [unclassified Candidatus Accumulibacter]EXI88818.1 MAG: Chloramphenicol acetyltransferase [Candidatus Accumulibacter regalis]MQM34060.1 acetyltransferase [Candidatus Accumulibacter phosphatis]MBN8512763.1 CatB-related O-acetyltransferase [Accumulibacter sp.]MBO3701475.1 CatB-related O-acetyltransferase [Accumulibacter sp.]HRE69697.1 CatB-related O-acetyltransferase [Accumulibacter sp.]
MGFWARFLERRAKKTIRNLSKFYRGPARFRRRYPQYQIGVGTYGVPIVHDWKEGTILKLGSYTSIAETVEIFLGGHHRTEWVTTYPFPAMIPEAADIQGYAVSRGDVLIGSDVWLCSNAVILSGVSVGHGAVVAAGAVVSENVAPYSVVAGNPARHIRWRFPEATRQALLEAAWWDWPEQEVRKLSRLLCSEQVEAILAYARQRALRQAVD